MLTIVISILFGVGLIFLATRAKDPGIKVGFCYMGILIPIFLIPTSLFFASDYEEEGELVKTTELVTLSNSTMSENEECIFVERLKENVYTYKYKISSQYGTDTSTEYETDTVSGTVIEIEDPNCEVPVLLEYKKKAKPTIWSFGFFNSKTEYVFYVPTGTIDKK